MTSSKNQMLSGAAFIRPTALERSMGRLMRSPEGHADPAPAPAADPAPAPAPAPDPAPAPAPTPPADPAVPPVSALNGGDDPAPAKTPEEIAAETKTAEEAAAAAKAAAIPEAYELTPPDGLTFDPADITEATPVFKELGLTNEQANKLMPVAAAFAQRTVDKLNAQILSQVQADRKAWLDTAKADPEIGGAKWNETLATGAAALDRLGATKGTPFRVLLDESGLGNHPEMIRMFAKVGQAIGDDSSLVRGDGRVITKRDTSEILYPNDQPKQGA